MAKVKIKLDSKGMDAVLDDTAPILGDIAAGWAATAISTAPVDSGEYRDSIDSTVTTAAALGIPFQSSPTRPVGVTFTTAPHGMVVEAKTGNLKRAMR